MDATRRARLDALLAERGALLRPGPALIAQVVARCQQTPQLPASSGAHAAARVRSGLLSLPARPPAPITLTPGPAAPTGVTVAATIADDHPPADTTADRLAPGLIIAGYRIEGLLGAGGMGQVYRATQLSMNRTVAFKVLARQLAGTPAFRERFLREAHAAGRLHHPNLISVHDVGECDGLMFFSMELVEGETLRQRLRQGPMAEAEVTAIARQTLRALRYAHEQGVIHRDIKPDNLMLTRDGVLKVADLGLSRFDGGGDDASTTLAGTLMGTPHYMAPEQARDAHAAGARADLYALGATLYHLATGHVPFTGSTAMAVVMAHATSPLTFPADRPGPRLRALIAHLMAKDPAERPADAAAALALLDAAEVPRLPPPAAALVQRTGRRRLLHTLGAAAAILAIGLGVAWAIGEQRRRDGAQRQDAKAAEILAQAQRGEHANALARALALADGPDASPVAAALPGRVAALWAAWSASTAEPALRRVDEALRQGSLDEAERLFLGIPRDRLDPTWRDAAKRVLDRLHPEAGPDADSAPLVLPNRQIQPASLPPAPALDARGERVRQQLTSGWWQRLRPNPVSDVRGHDRILRGSGSATQAPPALGHPPLPTLHLAISGEGRVRLRLGEVAIEVKRSGATAMSDGQVRSAIPAGPRHDVRLPLLLDDGQLWWRSERGWERLGAGGPLLLSWDLGQGEAAIRLDPPQRP